MLRVAVCLRGTFWWRLVVSLCTPIERALAAMRSVKMLCPEEESWKILRSYMLCHQFVHSAKTYNALVFYWI
jgi:hypothetical protein